MQVGPYLCVALHATQTPRKGHGQVDTQTPRTQTQTPLAQTRTAAPQTRPRTRTATDADTATRRGPLTIIFTDAGDVYDTQKILRAHLAEFEQEYTFEPTTLCGYGLHTTNATYRYSASRIHGAFARCDMCFRTYNDTHDRRTPQYLGRPTRRARPSLSTYTPDGRTAHAARVDAARYDRTNIPVPATQIPSTYDAQKREHTRTIERTQWLAAQRAIEARTLRTQRNAVHLRTATAARTGHTPTTPLTLATRTTATLYRMPTRRARPAPHTYGYGPHYFIAQTHRHALAARCGH
jgi:hypothetical protein